MKTILLTGACGGIGQALARALDAEGYHLLLLDLDPLSLEALDGELQQVIAFGVQRTGERLTDTAAGAGEEDGFHGSTPKR